MQRVAEQVSVVTQPAEEISQLLATGDLLGTL
jgi:hypothetical protein